MLTYILPLKARAPAHDLTSYLEWLAPRAQVVVVDASPPEVFGTHHRAWSDLVQHIPVDPDLVTPMGKVGGVLTGLRRAEHPKAVIADDDVRYSAPTLQQMEHLLHDAELVRPQNYFEPRPWHARWDTARSLIARATGGDWPGTLGVDTYALWTAGGYRGDVLFENLELARTVEARGGDHLVADDLFVERRPPTTRAFWAQRTRQAYDELARPGHLVVTLAILPAVIVGRTRAVAAIAVASMLLAERGRRRHGGCAAFGPTAAMWAPLWTAERAITSWLAVGDWLLGRGAKYGDVRLRHAASPPRALRRAHRPLPAGARRSLVGVA
jgi:hypothetical protein